MKFFCKNILVPRDENVGPQRSRSFKTRDHQSRGRPHGTATVPQLQNAGPSRAHGSNNGSAALKRGTVAVPRFQYAAPCVLAIFILCVLLNTVEVFGHCFALCNTVSYCAWGASSHWNRGIAHEQCQNSDKQYQKKVLSSATQYKFTVIQ